MTSRIIKLHCFSALLIALYFILNSALLAEEAKYLSPIAIVRNSDNTKLFIACGTANKILVFETKTEKVINSISIDGKPSGLTINKSNDVIFVSCASHESVVYMINGNDGKMLKRFYAGHTARSPVLSPDGKRLYVCNQFNNNIYEFDIESGRELRRIDVIREPVSIVITPDNKYLLVANHLPVGRADEGRMAAEVTIIDIENWRVFKNLRLPNGSTDLKEIKISPDGKFACVTHLLSRFHMPTTQLDRGWMNTNAKTIIDLTDFSILNTVLLDEVDRGAANPWGIEWTDDGKFLCITHAGTHEVSIIDFPQLIYKLKKLPKTPESDKAYDYVNVSRCSSDVPNDLSFLVGLRKRISLSEDAIGPRSLTIINARAYILNYFSDSVSIVDINTTNAIPRTVLLGEKKPVFDKIREGEMYFHDARLCFQGWQSCASCHPDDARIDGLNWDLLNDGIGNPKNTRSLLFSHKTPPAMSLGVRDTAETAVRSGIRYILFGIPDEKIASAIDEYLKSLKPVPSPFLVKGSLSSAAVRGMKIFDEIGCASCHPHGLYTDLQQYDVGTAGTYDKSTSEFDTPTLIEVWRTSPYLHDGSAITLKEVLTTKNKNDIHGKTSQLTEQQLKDLIEFLLSL